jgi:protein arginine N-methyltransferase 7
MYSGIRLHLSLKLGAKKVLISEKNPQMRQVLKDYLGSNDIAPDRLQFLETPIADLKSEHFSSEKIDFIFGEPNFSLSLLPWHNLLFWYSCNQIRGKANMQMLVMPQKAEIWAVPVRFQDLWKIRSPLHQVEGFNMKKFDDIIMVSNFMQTHCGFMSCNLRFVLT